MTKTQKWIIVALVTALFAASCFVVYLTFVLFSRAPIYNGIFI